MSRTGGDQASAAGGFICPAPAKVNLALHVTGMLAGGYHRIDTIVAFADIGDRLFARLKTSHIAERSDLAGNGPFGRDLPTAGDNLVSAAFSLLADANPSRDLAGIEARLEKNLPVASGLGGGSADAAAALRVAAKLWQIPNDFDLYGLALQLGADVPMCLASRAARAQGKGEILTPVTLAGPIPAVLVNPGIAMPTARVFAGLSRKENQALEMDADKPLEISFLQSQRNDLQGVAIGLAPEIAAVIRTLDEQPGCALARMSGSGATCFGIFDDPESAEAAALTIRRQMPRAWCVATRLGSPDITPQPLTEEAWHDRQT